MATLSKLLSPGTWHRVVSSHKIRSQKGGPTTGPEVSLHEKACICSEEAGCLGSRLSLLSVLLIRLTNCTAGDGVADFF
jgi:hypothetical protein